MAHRLATFAASLASLAFAGIASAQNPADTPKPVAPAEVEERGVSVGAFGLRGSVTRVGADLDRGSNLTVAGRGEEFINTGPFAFHGSHSLAIGGGSAGFEGELGATFAWGFRLPTTPNQGFVVRAGGLGLLRGNDLFYTSLLEIPRGELGYQYLRGRWLIEGGFTTGPVLTGRFRAGDAEARALGAGFEVGAYIAAENESVRLAGRFLRVPDRDGPQSYVRMLDATACAFVRPLALCTDVSFARGDVFTVAEPLGETRSVYSAGILIGVVPKPARPQLKPPTK